MSGTESGLDPPHVTTTVVFVVGLLMGRHDMCPNGPDIRESGNDEGGWGRTGRVGPRATRLGASALTVLVSDCLLGIEHVQTVAVSPSGNRDQDVVHVERACDNGDPGTDRIARHHLRRGRGAVAIRVTQCPGDQTLPSNAMLPPFTRTGEPLGDRMQASAPAIPAPRPPARRQPCRSRAYPNFQIIARRRRWPAIVLPIFTQSEVDSS